MLALHGSDKNVKVVAIQGLNAPERNISKIFSKRFPMGHFQILVSMSMPTVLSKSAVCTILQTVPHYMWLPGSPGLCLSIPFASSICQNVIDRLAFLELLFLCNFFSFHIYGAPKYNHTKTIQSLVLAV